MNIMINGTTKNCTANALLSDIVRQFTSHKNVITEVNGTIVPYSQWQEVQIKDGDAIELVTFVGGG